MKPSIERTLEDLQKVIEDSAVAPVRSPLGIPILDNPQFTQPEVEAATGLTKNQVTGWLDRNLIKLAGRHNPGKGHRRLFAGRDVILLASAQTLSGLGLPVRVASLIADTVYTRATSLLMGLAQRHGFRQIIYPLPGGDFQFLSFYDDEEPEAADEDSVFAFIIFAVDKLIVQTLTALNDIITTGEASPRRKLSAAKPEPDPDPLRLWDTDDAGNHVLVGLTVDETREYVEHIQGLVNDDHVSDPTEGDHRYLELDEKHEKARIKRLFGPPK